MAIRINTLLLVAALLVLGTGPVAASGDGMFPTDPFGTAEPPTVSDGWFTVTIPEGQEGVPVGIGDGVYDFAASEDLKLFCDTDQGSGMQETSLVNGFWNPIRGTGTVTGPCTVVMLDHHNHEEDHDHHDEDDVTFRWRPSNTGSSGGTLPVRFNLTGNTFRNVHELGRLPEGRWRIRNFRGVEVTVRSSDSGKCSKRSTRPRMIFTVGDKCSGDIEIRVRNRTGENYRLWVVKLDD